VPKGARAKKFNFGLEYFLISASASIGSGNGRSYIKGAPFNGVLQMFGRVSCPKLLPGSATAQVPGLKYH